MNCFSVCLDKKLSSNIFQKQSSRLILTFDQSKNSRYEMMKMCNLIFPMFIKLTHLTFAKSFYENKYSLVFDVPYRKFSSSNLLVLNIKIQSVWQFVPVLDGRFAQLHTLTVDLINAAISTEINDTNKVCFQRKFHQIPFAFLREIFPILGVSFSHVLGKCQVMIHSFCLFFIECPT